MGRVFVVGAGCARASCAAPSPTTSKRLREGAGHYTLLCNEDGGIIDDPYVYRLDRTRFLFVGNASNADRDIEGVRSGAASIDVRTARIARSRR